MSNPPTKFRAALHVRKDMLSGTWKEGETRILIPIPALNEQGALEAAWPTGITQSCISCDNFVSEREICLLAGQRPPARVIAFGCEKYADDQDVPF